MTLDLFEAARLRVQEEIDSTRSLLSRNQLGQFATPPALSKAIVRATRTYLPKRKPLRFIEPAFGTGSFYSALLSELPNKVEDAVGFEIDPAFVAAATKLWRHLEPRLHCEDFTQATPPQSETDKPNLLICNPPYVRHHHINKELKKHLKAQVKATCDISISGLAGLYCYFVILADAWLAKNAVSVWLLPTEFLEVNYGSAVKDYLLRSGTLLRLHRFDPEDVQFSDALVTSVVVWFKKGAKPKKQHQVEFTFGGDVERPTRTISIKPGDLKPKDKWTRYFSAPPSKRKSKSQALFGDYFRVRRGIATGANNYFVRPREEFRELGIPEQFMLPILPSPRYLKSENIRSEADGYPSLSTQLALISCDLPEEAVAEKAPALIEYLKQGRDQAISERYLCRHREPWYAQEKRPAAPFLCTYMGRKRGKDKPIFRFILNRSQAIAANVYLMLYPIGQLEERLADDPSLYERVWEGLRNIDSETLLGESRVYGGGLQKLEPKELKQVPLPWLPDLLAN